MGYGIKSMIAVGLLILSQFPLLLNYETIFESQMLIKTWSLTFLSIALYQCCMYGMDSPVFL